MIGILLMSHGDLSKGVLNSLECIMGKRENIKALTLGIHDDISEFENKMNEAIEQLGKEGVLIMVDVLGGTPSNKACRALKNENVEILTGLNLPMVMQAIESREYITNLNELKENVKNAALDSIADLREKLGL